MAVQPALTNPIIVDLGKKKKKQIRRLKRGRGKLVAELEDVLAEVQAQLGSEANGKELVPVVLIYRRKRKRRRGGGLFPLL